MSATIISGESHYRGAARFEYLRVRHNRKLQGIGGIEGGCVD